MTMRNYKTQLSRRHFEIVARSVAATRMPEDVRRQVANQLAGELAQTNPRFNAYRFVKACGVND
jgi:hypothetical protein